MEWQAQLLIDTIKLLSNWNSSQLVENSLVKERAAFSELFAVTSVVKVILQTSNF